MSKPKTWDEHNGCGSCKYESLAGDEQPCRSCYGCNIHNDADNWEPAGTVATKEQDTSYQQCCTCKHEKKTVAQRPCSICRDYDRWEPAGTVATNDTTVTTVDMSLDDATTTATEPIIKDSGERREFETGAVRDMQAGKGRCDLMPLEQVARLTQDWVIMKINDYQKSGRTSDINEAIKTFCKEKQWSIPHAMLELSKHFENGAKKYGERNWEKGLPESCYIDSAVRHYLKWLDGWTDEPHDRAVLWNLMCLWWTHENIEKGGEK